MVLKRKLIYIVNFEYCDDMNINIYYVNLHSLGIDFRRLNLTSVDIRFWRLKSIPAMKE